MFHLLPLSLICMVNFLLSVSLFSSYVLAKSSSIDFRTLGSRYVTNLATQNSDSVGVSTSDDLSYIVDITLGGRNFTVLLDTGSSDLWIDPFYGQPELTNSTDLATEIIYGKGQVNGTIQFAELQIGDLTVKSQAFIQSNFVLDIDLRSLHGIMGMAFDVASIHRTMNATWGLEAADTLGRTPITSIFTQNTSLPNNFDLQLGRTDELDDAAQGTFVIAGHAEAHEAVADSPKLQRVSERYWSVAMDGMKINGKAFAFNKSLVAGVPQGKVAALLDSGTSLPLLPPRAVDEIYGSIPGAVFEPQEQFWAVPCTASANLSFTFAGQEFPVHPLDVTKTLTAIIDEDGGKNVTYCINAYQGLFLNTTEFTGFDIILGDAFLRNVYASFNYGNYTSNTTDVPPFVQMLSTTNASTMFQEFHQVRSAALAKLPPQISPVDLVRYAEGNAPVRSGLSTGAIVGIVILSLFVFGGIVALAVYLRKRRRQAKEVKYGPEYVVVEPKEFADGSFGGGEKKRKGFFARAGNRVLFACATVFFFASSLFI